MPLDFDVKLTSEVTPFAWFDSLEPMSCTLDLFSLPSGDWFSERSLYRFAEVTLLVLTCGGAVAAIALLISGLPGVALLMGLACVGLGLGAYVAHQAALASTVEEQVVEFEHNNTQFSESIEEFKKRISELEGEVKGLMGALDSANQLTGSLQQQIGDLHQTKEQLAARISELLTINTHFTQLATGFQSKLGQLDERDASQSAAFAVQLSEFTQLIHSSEKLWTEVQNTYPQIFKESLDESVSKLNEAISKLKKPEELAQLAQLHRQGQENVDNLKTQVNSLKEEIAYQRGVLEGLLAQISTAGAQLAKQNKRYSSLVDDQESIVGRLSLAVESVENVKDFIATSPAFNHSGTSSYSSCSSAARDLFPTEMA